MKEFQVAAAIERKIETDIPGLRETDKPRLPPGMKIRDISSSKLSDTINEALKKAGLISDVTEKNSDAHDSSEKNDYAEHIEKGEDGKYHDKETGKSYESIEAWVKALETLAKKYEGVANYYKNKADKEWAKFKNAEANGDSEEEKWEHYRRAQEYYAKAKEAQEKAEKTREKISRSAEANEYSEANEHSETKENSETNEHRETSKQDNGNETTEVNKPIQNKMDGLAREKEVSEELEKQYPKEEGYEIVSEVYLRDKDGKIVRDPETGEARRVDFVVIKDGKVVDSVEVTSKTADKGAQTAKENRIRASGGNYVRDNNGNLVEIPSNVTTRIERRD